VLAVEFVSTVEKRIEEWPVVEVRGKSQVGRIAANGVDVQQRLINTA
jgi:hypothetical protein